MIRFMLFLILLIAAVWLGLHLHKDPGYVLIAYGKSTLEMPLWFGILLGIISFIIIYWLLRFFNFGCGVSGKMRLWSRRKRLRNAQTRTRKGLIDLAEGHWRRAEKNLVKGTDNNDAPLINYLAAAKAAQEQAAYERRDNYLRQAHRVNPDAKIAVELTQAQLQMHHKQSEQALATLRHLQELAPQHSYVLKLLKILYIELKDWKSLIAILPDMRRAKALSKDEFETLELQAYKNYLETLINSQTPESIETLWQQAPKHIKYQPEIVALYCDYLINATPSTENKKRHQSEQAEKLIRETLKKHWDASLLHLYTRLPEIDRKKQLTQAEYWLKTYANDSDLLLCSGRLAKANQLWGKARSYFEASLGIKASKAAYTELGQLYEHLNEIPMALDCYRKAIRFD